MSCVFAGWLVTMIYRYAHDFIMCNEHDIQHPLKVRSKVSTVIDAIIDLTNTQMNTSM